MHVNRLFTHLPDAIPQEAAQEYGTLISMSAEGEYVLTDAFEKAIADAKGAVDHLRDERKRKREAKASRRSKKRRGAA